MPSQPGEQRLQQTPPHLSVQVSLNKLCTCVNDENIQEWIPGRGGQDEDSSVLHQGSTEALFLLLCGPSLYRDPGGAGGDVHRDLHGAPDVLKVSER